MDFNRVIKLIGELFKKHDINYAIMGGFGVGLHGIQRFTRDIDILIDKKDMNKLHFCLEDEGYKRIYHNQNVSQYSSKIPALGNLGFVLAFRKISHNMLERSMSVKLKGFEIKVLQPEDIIGLKVQGMANDPKRILQDKADIENILNEFGGKVDWKLLEEYFLLFDMEKYYMELKGKYGKTE
ncbi:MAG: nucleotidyltransferase [Elusimicrobiota bacterium]